MKDTIDFTDRERFVLAYFRNAGLSSWKRRCAIEGALILLSLFCIALYLTQHDVGWGFVGYILLLWRACNSLWRTQYFMGDYRSIFAKYDAKIKELANAPTKNIQEPE